MHWFWRATIAIVAAWTFPFLMLPFEQALVAFADNNIGPILKFVGLSKDIVQPGAVMLFLVISSIAVLVDEALSGPRPHKERLRQRRNSVLRILGTICFGTIINLVLWIPIMLLPSGAGTFLGFALIGVALYAFAPFPSLLANRYLIRWEKERGMPLQETRCRKCGHILHGITEARCPECGERI